MGKYSTITSGQVIASAKERLNLTTTDYDIFLEMVVLEGARHLDAFTLFSKCEVELKVEDGKAKLPCGFHSLLGVRHNCSPYFYVDTDFLQSCGCDINRASIRPYGNTFQINDGYIFFSMVQDEDITDVWLSYVGMVLDSEGMILLREDWERGLAAYASYRYSQRFYKEFPANIREEFRLEWTAQKRWVMSNAVYDDFKQTQAQVREWWNAWISDKNLI